MDLKEERSRILTSTALLPVLDTISVHAASALCLFLQARITLAPEVQQNKQHMYNWSLSVTHIHKGTPLRTLNISYAIIKPIHSMLNEANPGDCGLGLTPQANSCELELSTIRVWPATTAKPSTT